MPAQIRASQKRKRQATDAGHEEITVNSLQRKLHHCIKEVKKSAKKTKGAEIQKLVKNLKKAREESGTSASPKSLETKLDAIKTIDQDRVACLALHRKILKDPILSENSMFMEAVTLELPPESRSRSAANEEADNKLLSSKHFSDSVKSAVTYLLHLVDPSSIQEQVENEEAVVSPTKSQNALSSKRHPVSTPRQGKTLEQVLIDEDLEDHEPESDDGWESGSVDEDGHIVSRIPDVVHDSDTDMRSEDNHSSSDHEHSVSPPTKRSKQSSTSAKPMESTFLPSLSVGFTRGDSDASDVEDLPDLSEPRRRNRRGQQARRAIWEQMYGKNANHLKKQLGSSEQTAKSRKARQVEDQGRRQNLTKRAKSSGSNQTKPSFSRQVDHPIQAKPQTSDAPVVNKKPMATPKSVHPSWEAKQKAKERESINLAQAPRGKKIVFT
ncbi:hypothetical protein FRC03_003388 [Tulasnella sp. 419]|nr:hypothetical protein FRC03_003388 [Tulasnella sp. 419]